MTIFIVTTGNPAFAQDPDRTGAEVFAKDRVASKFYRNKGHADAAAKVLAKKYPGEMFAVFKVDSFFEAKEPEIMEKVLDEQGQIVPKG